jgi:hypothetical protein
LELPETNNQEAALNYRNFIGLDAHCKNCFFVAMNRHGKVNERIRVPTTERELLSYLRSVKGPKALTFEETSLSQWLYVLLRDEVENLVISDPTKNKRRAGPKTDYIDATELADLLRVNRLHPVFHTGDALMELRTLVSGYEDLVQELVRSKNRFKALFHQSGIPVSGTKVYSEVTMIRQLSTEAHRFAAKRLFALIAMLEKQKADYEKMFERNVRSRKEQRLVDSIPGFGAIRTNQVVGIVVTPYRFPTKYNFFSYAMLVKHSQNSDGKTYGKKQACGRRQLKGIFKGAALTAIRTDNAFRRKYDQKRRDGIGDKEAKNNIARMLAATVLGVWKSGKRYNDHCWEVAQQNGCHRRK